MSCSICLDEDTKIDYITQCNHLFHKKCFFKANYKKLITMCPMCRHSYITVSFSKEIHMFQKIPDDIQNTLVGVKDVLESMDISEYFIGGSFIINLYQRLKNAKRDVSNWKIDTIDIYTGEDIQSPTTLSLLDHLIVPKHSYSSPIKLNAKKSTSYEKQIEEFIRYEIYKVDSLNENTLTKVINLNIYKTYRDISQTDECIDAFFSTIDLDCCKILANFYTKQFDCNCSDEEYCSRCDDYGPDIIFYIANESYVDSISCDYKCQESRIKKYIERGFECKLVEE